MILRVRWRLRRISRCFFTWRRMSSAISWIECSMSGEASFARSVTPFKPSVASATMRSEIRGFFSSQSSTSSTASSETCLPTLWKRWITAWRISSVTSTFRPRTSILISRLLPFGLATGCYDRDALPARTRCLEGSREGQRDNPPAASLTQRPGTGRERRARGPDIVHQQRPAWTFVRRPDSRRIVEPLRSPSTHLAPAARTAEAADHWQAGKLGKRECELLRWIEPAPAPAPRSGRHRDNGVEDLMPRQRFQHRYRRHLGERQPPRVLEAVHDLSGHPIEGRCGDRDIHPRRAGIDHPRSRLQVRRTTFAENGLRLAARPTGCAERGGDQRDELVE